LKGAKDQIQKQVKEYIELENDDDIYKASYYLAKITLESVANLFSQAHQIKKWLIDCCHIAVVNNQPISWITPLGIPIVQPYRTKSMNEVIKTFLMDFEMASDSSDLPLSKRRQKSAFPPNYVHR
jgi:DNA-directed RNA polymerase